jgi:hypothetical protein
VSFGEGSRHVLPTSDEHLTEGLDCWCVPTYFVPCDECENGEGCWKCDDGKVWLTHAEALDEPQTIVVVHNR